jgi:hypothetical protein
MGQIETEVVGREESGPTGQPSSQGVDEFFGGGEIVPARSKWGVEAMNYMRLQGTHVTLSNGSKVAAQQGNIP